MVVISMDMTNQREANGCLEGSELGDTGDTLAFHLSRAWIRFHNTYADALRPLQLTPSRMLGLAYLVYNDDADQATLGRSLGINRASTMALVDKLQAAGYAVRKEGADKRTHALAATAQGRVAYRKGMELERRIEQALLQGISRADVEHLRFCLAKVACSDASI
ncbi:MarR family transcriptional regulator [Comamonas sp. 26]|nr:MarR family transcriptional regulator [Comamonas sp. 26]